MMAEILIADDHYAWRRGVKSFLERHSGWHVCAEAEDGEQAVSKAAECRPDIIVLDLAMPVMNGLNAAREIHRYMPTVPILLHTAYKLPQVEVEAKKAGVQAVVSKEDTGELVKTIEVLLHEETLH